MGQSLIWLLDDTCLGHLAQSVDQTTLSTWDTGRLRAASTTLDSARATPHGARRTLELINTCSPAGEPLIEECLVEFGGSDPAAEILVELHPDGSVTKNLAEREAIAWCLAHDEAVVFVSDDKRAVLSALAELGRERVAHPFDVWLDLLDLGWVDVSQFRSLCRLTRKKDQGLERMPGRVQQLMGSS